MPTPPRPAEALSFPSAQHVAPNLLFHPVFDEAEALRWNAPPQSSSPNRAVSD